MNIQEYLQQKSTRSLVKGWLFLGILSLLVAGLLAILLVLSRTPYVQDYFPLIDFFHVALVVHVDLSVMIWFIAFAGVLWSLLSGESLFTLGSFALYTAALGTIVIAISPFLGAHNPLMNNYVPVLNDRIFLIGLLILFTGFGLLVVRALLTISLSGILKESTSEKTAALRYGLFVGAVSGAIAIVLMILSFYALAGATKDEIYYERLFWGGGHVLQFMHSVLMLVVWLLLFKVSNVAFFENRKFILSLFSIILVASLVGIIVHRMYEIDSVSYRHMFTELMEYGPGFSVGVLALVLLPALFCGKWDREHAHLRAAITTSIILFGAGGLIGFLIEGVNVKIPAHYHGVIVGVTLAYMGLAYYLLPELGYKWPSVKLSVAQLYIYGAGQLMHITGLALAGEFGVMRKVAGEAQHLDSLKKVLSMGLMGSGGLVAVIGGILFLIVTLSALKKKTSAS